MGRADTALEYRAARLVDMGLPDRRVATETGAPKAMIRRMRQSKRNNRMDADAPTEAELVIIRHMGEKVPTTTPAAEMVEDLADVCGITERAAENHLAQMSAKGLITGGKSAWNGRTLLPGHDMPGAPRAAAMLVRQATEGGYRAGTSDQKDTDLRLAGHLISEATTLVRVEHDAATAMIERACSRDSRARAHGWPSSQSLYIEFSHPLRPVEAPEGAAIEGFIVAQPDGKAGRDIITLLSDNGKISNHAFHFNPDRERIEACGETNAAPPEDDGNVVFALMHEILEHLCGGDGHLVEGRLSRAERRRRERGERTFVWLEVASATS